MFRGLNPLQPPPVPVARSAGTCRNVLPERCDSVRLNVLQRKNLPLVSCSCCMGAFYLGGGWTFEMCMKSTPPLAHARPCLSTGWALNRCFEEILGPLFLWSRMEDWVFVECLYRERGAQSCL